MRRPPTHRKRVIEERDERHKEKEINRPLELKIVIWSSLTIFFIVTVYFLLGNDDTGDWESAAPGTVMLNTSKKSAEDGVLIELYDRIQPEEANAIVIAYMKHLTGTRPSMALRSALPTKESEYWPMNLYYLDEEEAGEHANRQILVHKLNGEIKSEGLPTMSLEELSKNSTLRIEYE